MNKIREIRKERVITQEDSAKKISVSRKYLSAIETRNAAPAVYPAPIRYIDLFCGIGGFRYAASSAFEKLGLSGECVFSSDIDKFAQESYAANFSEKPAGDITKINASEIPDFDLLFGGFPCQAFSICGLQKGFADSTRGTLFFDIARIIKEKRPQAFVLENVKNLASHDNGNTLKTILSVLRDELGYHVDYRLLNALDFGLPQKRERIVIIGSKKTFEMNWNFNIEKRKTLNDILETNVDKKYYASEKIIAKRKSIHAANNYPSIWHENKSGNISSYPYSCALRAGASYNYLLVNGERRLTPREMLRLQGFPDSFKIVVSDAQIRKQAGNAIPVDMVAKVIEEFLPIAF